ncbi:YadA-like family protein [Aggregatibacter sp. oral taxon 513]|uniref:YadA-like family protein n=1 Tax=Aggregatibacter sp. oral taxon 513 TaxID=712150 RepID=UPI001BAA075E|nr:YadA-like family protein [Aggregatibacter sp. oral taxon 513]QUC05992.1 YadA-like family protein [Aggregatibacter sp. oral taxon 513]
MNNIYKVIWSKVTNVLVVVSELARSKGVSGRNSTAASSNTAKVRTKLTALSVALSFCFGASSVFAADVNTPNVTATTSLTVGAAGTAGGAATGTTTLHGTATLNGKNLATTDDLANKANQADLTALQNTVNGKANQADLTALQNTVNGKASQGDLDALKTDFNNHKTDTDDKLEKLKTATEKLGIGTTYNGIKYFRANSTGADATAGGTDAVAIGPEAKAAGNNTVAVGMNASSYGAKSVTVGHGAAASGTASSSVVLGHSAQVGTKTEDPKYDGAQKIMIGDGKSGIAIGDHAVSRGDESIAIGKDALTTNKDKAETLASKSIAIGSGARSIGSNSAIAFGNGALNHWGADSSIAMGQDAESKDANTISIGHAASAEKGGLAIGTTAKSSEAGVALGELASSTTNGIAIGKSASANQNKTISIGLNAGVGQDADVTGTKHSNINIGVDSGTNVVGQFNVALGEKAGQYVRGKASVAIGLEAGKNISSSSSPETLIENVSIGNQANARDGQSSVVRATALGSQTQAEDMATAVGYGAKAKKSKSVAIGNESATEGEESVAIGSSAQAHGGSVALGAHSVANDKDGAGVYTGMTSKSVVSVGNDSLYRRLVNVADGADDQDAVTVKQLKKLEVELAKTITVAKNTSASVAGAVLYDTDDGDNDPETNSVTFGGPAGSPAGSPAKLTRLQNVASGKSDTDAVNVKQLKDEIAQNSHHYFSVNDAKQTGIANYDNMGAKGERSMAIGTSAATYANNSVALGNKVTNYDEGGIAIGTEYVGSDELDDGKKTDNTTAVSKQNEGYKYGIALGAGSQTQGNNSIAIGSLAATSVQNLAEGGIDRAIALGYYAVSSGAKANAIGERARANSLQANAFGSQAQALAQSANAIGTAAMAAGANSIAIGSHQQVVGENSGSIGYAGTFTNKSIGASLLGDYGPGATRVRGSGTYSIGNMNGEIPSNESGVFGNNNLVRGSQNMRVMGNNNKIGNLAAKDADALPVKNVYVTGHGNTIDTANNPLEDSKNIFVMGAGNTIGSTSPAANGLKITDSYVIGTGNTINESNDLLDNAEDPSDPAAAGQKAKIGKGYFILGNNVNATLQNSVYLGTSSAFIGAGTVSAGKDNYSNFNSAGFPAYQYAGGAPVGVVTIGNATETRRLQGVAAGLVAENSTDAINGSQLYAHTRPMGFVADNSGAEGKDLNGLAIDDASITMVKRAAGQALKLNGGATGALSDNNIGTVVNGTNQVDIKLAKELKNLTSAQFGDDNANTTVNSSGVTIKDGPSFTKNSIDANNNKITKVAAGDVNANSTDAVNGSQLNAVKETAEKGWNLTTAGSATKHNVAPGGDVDISSANTNITVSNTQGNVKLELNKDLDLTQNGSVKVGNTTVNNSGVTIDNGPSVKATGINAGDKKITNVKAGEDDTDAVNYGQLKKVADSAATAGKGWTLSTGTGDNNKHVVKPEDEVNISGDTNITVTHDRGNVTVGLNKNLDLTKDGSVEIGSTTLNKEGLAVGTNVKVTDNGLTAGKVSVTTDGINAGNEKITNVADGTIAADSKDAVNGGQLHKVKTDLETAVTAAKTEVEAGENVTVTTQTGTGKQTIYTVSAKDTSASVSNGSDMIKVDAEAEAKKGTVHVTNYKVDLSDKAKADIQKGVDAKTIVDTKGLTFVADKNSKTEVRKLGDEVGIKGDTNITTTANGNDVNVTLNKELKDLTSAQFVKGNDSTTVDSQGVTITDGPSMTKNGIAMNDKSITGLKSVLDGVTDVTKVEDDTKLKSAVNVGDLKKVATDAFGLKDKAGNEFKQNLGTTAQITGDKNVNTKVVDAKDGKKALEVSLSNNVTLGGSEGADGKDGQKEDGTLAVKSKDDQNSVTLNGKDGSIDIDGADAKGKVTVAQGATDVNGAAGEKKTRIVYDVDGSARELVATLNDGLKFGANDGAVHKAPLNTQVDIKGAATNTDWTKFDGGSNIMTKVEGNTVTVGLAKDVNVNSVTATEHVTVGGTTKITNDGVTIKDGPSMTKSNGIDANNMTIKNVAPGVNNTDAVNVGQLRILEGKVNRVDRNLRAGVAGANAAASLPQAYLPGKNMVAVSAGTYRGEGAIALGVSRVSDNGKVVVKLTGNSDTRGNFGAGVGAGYQW